MQSKQNCIDSIIFSVFKQFRACNSWMNFSHEIIFIYDVNHRGQLVSFTLSLIFWLVLRYISSSQCQHKPMINLNIFHSFHLLNTIHFLSESIQIQKSLHSDDLFELSVIPFLFSESAFLKCQMYDGFKRTSSHNEKRPDREKLYIFFTCVTHVPPWD